MQDEMELINLLLSNSSSSSNNNNNNNNNNKKARLMLLSSQCLLPEPNPQKTPPIRAWTSHFGPDIVRDFAFRSLKQSARTAAGEGPLLQVWKPKLHANPKRAAVSRIAGLW